MLPFYVYNLSFHGYTFMFHFRIYWNIFAKRKLIVEIVRLDVPFFRAYKISRFKREKKQQRKSTKFKLLSPLSIKVSIQLRRKVLILKFYYISHSEKRVRKEIRKANKVNTKKHSRVPSLVCVIYNTDVNSHEYEVKKVFWHQSENGFI